ncbi:MAG: hypothetical protein ABJP66_05640 [Hyphomicrobiales bacterium]
MTILGSFFLIGPCGFVYLILAGQVSAGFPPFYKKSFTDEDAMSLAPFMFAIIVLLGASVFVPHLFILFGLISLWCGVRLRRTVQNRTNGPLPWLLNPLTIGVMNRWPMLLFDVWTTGLTALMGLIMMVR